MRVPSLVTAALLLGTQGCGVMGPPPAPHNVREAPGGVAATRVTLPLKVDGQRQDSAWRCYRACHSGSSTLAGMQRCIARCPDAERIGGAPCSTEMALPNGLCFELSEVSREDTGEDAVDEAARSVLRVVGTTIVVAFYLGGSLWVRALARSTQSSQAPR